VNAPEPQETPAQRLLQLIEQTRGLLESEREAGRIEVGVDPAFAQQLGTWPQSSATPARSADPARSLAAIAERVARCTACPLHATRTRTVPGQGAFRPDILFVGEGPGHDEDLQGVAFVGRAGQLLTRIIEAMGYTREEVFIGNIVKCRPPNNRAPEPDEMAACLPFLREQIALLQPRVIVALGGTAVKGLLQIEEGITRVRGQWQRYAGIDLMPTFHPSYLLRNPAGKRHVWADMLAVLDRLGRRPPERPQR